MDRDTFDTTLRAFTHRRPFRPFTVALIDGQRVNVDQPDAMAIRDGTALFVGPDRTPVVMDHRGVTQVTDDPA